MLRLKSALLTLCIFFGASAHAQYIPPFQPAMDIGVAGSIYLGDEATYDGLTRKGGARSKGPQHVSNVALNYAPAKSRTHDNLQALGKRLAASDPATAQQAEQLFATNDVIGAVQDVMDQFGLERNNVAHAYAVYWVVYWGLANKVSDTPSPAAMQAVAAQAERGFAVNAEFAAMDNAQKQATAEELMALTAIMDATSEQAKTDPALADQIAKASLEGSRKSGLDLDAMTLTENGFVPAKPRKRSDASDVAGEEKALAANDAGQDAGQDSGGEKDEGLSPTQLAMIAAAGGAGLGAVFLLGKVAGKKG
jgi:hypothetical protein